MQTINELNAVFSLEAIEKVEDAIINCINKEAIAK